MKKLLNTPIQDTTEEYLSKKAYIDASDICKILKSPRHYEQSIHDKKEKELEKKTLIISEATHTYLKDEKLFNSKYCCLKNQFYPSYTPFKKSFETEKDIHYREVTFPMMNVGKIVLEQSEYETIVQSCSNAIKDDTINELFSDGLAGVSIYSRDEKTQLKTKARVSFMPNHGKYGNVVVDARICMDSSEDNFSKEIANFGYHNKASHLLKLFKRGNFLFIALEKFKTAIPEIYSINQHSLDIGAIQNRMALDILAWSIENNYWASYSELTTLKKIYIKNALNTCDMPTTTKMLNSFFDVKKKSLGIIEIGLPRWYVKDEINQLVL